jgi:hypothetical protein
MRENYNYIIIYAYRLNEEEEIVLGKKQIGEWTHFVTWMCNNQGRNYFCGHYFDNEIDALEDLVERIKKEIR